MRSDTLQRHSDSKHTDVEKPGVKEQLLIDNELFYKNVEIGKYVFDMIASEGIVQESLSKEHAYALNLYNKMRPIIDVETAELRPWQQQVLQLIQLPTARQVIWIKGMCGNEGKSWLQSYVQSMFGYARAVRLDFKSKVNDIYLTLFKRPLSKTDIFMFNDGRSSTEDMKPCYPVLEAIKDGSAINGKYQSDVVRFKTPNIVIVFSNVDPDIMQLSRDRWQIFNITKDGLKRYDGRLSASKKL